MDKFFRMPALELPLIPGESVRMGSVVHEFYFTANKQDDGNLSFSWVRITYEGGCHTCRGGASLNYDHDGGEWLDANAPEFKIRWEDIAREKLDIEVGEVS